MADILEDSVVTPSCRSWYQWFIEQVNDMRQQQRLPHAMLLSLQGEVDETEFLWFLAMSLLCRDGKKGQPCRHCKSCQLMVANTYPDFSIVGLQYDEKSKKNSKNIKIEQIRNLIHEVNLTRSYDNLKIVVIYPADKMSIAGANSLLKTLEEPAENALIILATHKPGRIPVTIRSRCQQWALRLPPLEEALEWLQKEGLNSETALQYLELADGDPILALKLYAIEYVELVTGFKQQFAQFLKNQIDVVKLSQFLVGNDVTLIRRLVAMVVKAYGQQYSGLQDAPINKASARAMLDLSIQIERQLMIEENNLDIQLQLEDVLISIKQIIIHSHQ